MAIYMTDMQCERAEALARVQAAGGDAEAAIAQRVSEGNGGGGGGSGGSSSSGGGSSEVSDVANFKAATGCESDTEARACIDKHNGRVDAAILAYTSNATAASTQSNPDPREEEEEEEEEDEDGAVPATPAAGTR